jgi:hypothetical protein
MQRANVNVLLLFAATSCYPLDARFALAVDATFTPQEACLTVAASDRWARATNGLVQIDPFVSNRVREPGSIARHTALRGYDADARAMDRSGIALGYTEITPGGPVWAYVDRIARKYPDRYAQAFLYVQIHELGHHLGLDHGGDYTIMAGRHGDGSPMYWSWDERGEPCITQADLDAFCVLYSCSIIAPRCELEPTAVDVCGE